jgi:translation initiation factor IF-1
LLEAIGPRAHRAALPNGKPVIAHLPAHSGVSAAALLPGCMVTVALTPYDFDHARIEGIVAAGHPRST